jgi:hypothetical protein
VQIAHFRIDRLRPDRLSYPDLGETLQYLAESFPDRGRIA